MTNDHSDDDNEVATSSSRLRPLSDFKAIMKRKGLSDDATPLPVPKRAKNSKIKAEGK